MSEFQKLNPPKDSEEALERARTAAKAIQGTAKRTVLDTSRACSELAGCKVHLKYENQQRTGSFKIRGALNKLSSLSEEEKKRGVIASSAGNHSQGVAFSAQRLGIEANLVMPQNAPLVKVEATQNYGAKVILHGDFYDEAYQHAKELADKHQYSFIHPFEDDLVIAGQSTIGLEIFEQAQDFDSIVVPIGGGGLISGIAMVAKALNPKVKVYGVQAATMPGMSCLFNNRRLREEVLQSTIADGIAVKTPSQQIYEGYIKRYVDEIVTVRDEDIAAAMVLLLERKKTVVEGAGATALAATLYGDLDLGESTIVVLCGGNVDLNTISKVIQKGLTQTGRLANFSVVVDDQPGTLGKITQIMGEHRANILQVDHNRADRELALRETRIDLLVETSNDEHVTKIRSSLKSEGFRLI